MPQIDTVAYFPIIIWSFPIICLGYIYFNVYLFLDLVSMRKILPQWKNYQVSQYWVNWNTVKVLDKLPHIQKVAKILQNYDFEKLEEKNQISK